MEDYPGNLRRRYQACLDVLGFTTTLTRLGALKLANAYDTAIKISEQRSKEVKKLLINPGVKKLGEAQESRDVPIYPNIFHVQFFSDTIFVFTIDDSAESLNQLCELSYCIFAEFMRHGLTLRGGIAAGESIVYPKQSLYVGKGIVDAYKLEQSLDLIGIVLEENLSCTASRPALVTFKCSHKQELHVPTHRNSMVKGDAFVRQFEFVRAQAGPNYRLRFENSIDVIAAMGKIDCDSLRLQE